MFCQKCGQELGENDRFCTKCGEPTGIKVIKKEQNDYPSRISLSNINIGSNTNELKKEVSSFFNQESTTKIILLMVVTLGFYGLFLLYNWIKVVNKASDKEFFSPSAAIIITLATLGLASVYFEYEVARRVEKLISLTGGLDARKRTTISPPINNFKETVLIVGIASYAISFFTGGILFIIPVVAGTWIYIKIQRSLEYLVDID